MKTFRQFIFVINLLIAFSLSAQVNSGNQVQTIEGKKYLIHQVQNGETIFSICKKYDVGQKELVGANPSLIAGLKQGEKLKIPFEGKDIPKGVVVEEQKSEAFITHVVKKTETVYSISKLYNVSKEVIYKYNPQTEKELKENETIRIPKQMGVQKADGLQKEDANFFYHQVQQGETTFALAQRYNSMVDDINKANPGVSDNLESGTIVRIPKKQIKQTIEPAPKRNGEFIQHEVEQGETFFSLKRKYGISKDDLIKLNPNVSGGLKVGEILNIPSSKNTKAENKQLIAKTQGQHIVVKGQTLYSIAVIYGVDVEEMKKINPGLKDGKLKSGEIIKIPKMQSKAPEKPVVVVPDKQVVSPVVAEEETSFTKQNTKQPTISRKETFRISMFLPLFYNKSLSDTKESDTDTAEASDSLKLDSSRYRVIFNARTNTNDTFLVDQEIRNLERTIYPDSRNFLEFYEGALIAIDSLQKAGAKIELTIYDTEFSAKKVEALMQNSKLINSNLIIGPVDVSLQKSISAFSYKNQIPIISPFSPDNSLVAGNPFYVQVNPTKDYVIKKTADFVGEKFRGKNIIVLNHWGSDKVREAKLVEQVREKFSSSGNQSTVHGIDYSTGGEAGTAQIRGALKADVENIVIMPSTDNRDEREAFLSRAINNLSVLSKDYNITLIGMSDYPRMKSINTENYHQLNLHYLTPQNIDYKSVQMNSFLQKYRAQFAAEPTLYSCRGYDLVWYFVHAFDDYGRNYIEKINNFDVDLLMSNFDFRRVKDLGGFMNYSLFIVNLTPEFDVNIPFIYSDGKFVKELN